MHDLSEVQKKKAQSGAKHKVGGKRSREKHTDDELTKCTHTHSCTHTQIPGDSSILSLALKLSSNTPKQLGNH